MLNIDQMQKMADETGIPFLEIQRFLRVRQPDPHELDLEDAGSDFNAIMAVVKNAGVMHQEVTRKALKRAIELATTPIQGVRILEAIGSGEPTLRRTAILKISTFYE